MVVAVLLVLNAPKSCFAQAKTSYRPFTFDTGVSGIRLQNAESTVLVLGKNAWTKRFEKPDDFSFIKIECLNADATERLRIAFFEGGFKNEAQVFKISRVTAGYKPGVKTIRTKIPQFTSQLGIHLGMYEQEVKKIIGGNYKTRISKGAKTLTWYTTNPKTYILSHYRAIGYTIECKFIRHQLTEYYFGFDYP